jgi:hypothetical protein
MHDEWTNRLSDYLGGDLDRVARAEVERHLAGCTACAATLAELDAVRSRAAGLADREPARDLWPGIAARLEPAVVDLTARRTTRRVVFSVPQLAAASIALVAISAGGAWLAARDSGDTQPLTAAPAAATAFQVNAAALSGDPGYDAAVAELQAVLRSNRDLLDSGTVAVLEQSLATIDQAIVEAREALALDPANEYVNAHLAATMRQKTQLLRQAVWLVGA